MDVEKSFKYGIWPPPEMRKYQDNYEPYIDNIFKLLRLVKRVYINPFAKYYYYVNDKGENESIMHYARFTKPSIYKVSKKDVVLLQHYIDYIDIMNLRSYLQLALDNYDMSFNSVSIVLGFLAIINGMEGLLLTGGSEKAFHLSRNIAVLLGKNSDESKEIFNCMKDLYKKRSKIVHEGRLDIVTDIDYRKALRYLSKAILTCISIDKDKTEIINLLDSIGYGQINTLSK